MDEKEPVEKPSGNVCRLANIFEAIGRLLVGVSALVGVLNAPEVVRDIYEIQLMQSQSQSQEVTVVLASPDIRKDITKLSEKAKNESPDKLLEDIPSSPTVRDGILQNVYISPIFRSEVKRKLERTDDAATRARILNDYFRKTIQFTEEDKRIHGGEF